MKVLVVGSGAREHALSWKLQRSQVITEVWAWPGNIVLPKEVRRLDEAVQVWQDAVRAAKAKQIDIVVVGPEGPLDAGIADYCEELGLKVFGPQRRIAKLESSKAFAKNLMADAGIPTAKFEVVKEFDAAKKEAVTMLTAQGGTVIKASGLAAGKGVFVCHSEAEIDAAIDRLAASMGAACDEIVIEEVLEGRECSYFCMLGENHLHPLGFAVDFKRAMDGDEGPNTGGMGCYTPVPWLPESAREQVHSTIIEPLLAEFAKRKISYVGYLYVGLMWSEQGPKVVEFNVRLGDPEAQVLALASEADWGIAIARSLGLIPEGSALGDPAVLPETDSSAKAVAVVLASSGYPFDRKIPENANLEEKLFANTSEEKAVFAASVLRQQEKIVPGAGRVATVVCRGKSFREARESVYGEIKHITASWPDVKYRSDIASRLSRD